ncbi:hypothetical protein HJC23_007399 [Cyclotella cryptica]|uniref:J domain-containing protein n=1 Tax=Cyclotella cryptica TaxID=29204 RepID=A0ABD3QK38_9STRA|eukprot:CCRYP_005113-RA/>CCRYP_005113-RA protein AED:0.01 eAED:0.01 QI:414/1/1/1/0/0/2/867/577
MRLSSSAASASLLLLATTITTTNLPLLHASPHPNHNHLTNPNPIESWYRQKPHDTVLYDILHVRPDATAGEITKSYRRLCLKWHPDKVRRGRVNPSTVDDESSSNVATKRKHAEHKEDATHSSPPPPPPPPLPTATTTTIPQEDDYAQSKLQQITHAHEILSNDPTRLLYHRYGIRDGIEGAMRLLSGEKEGRLLPLENDPSGDLWKLMGYNSHHHHHHPRSRQERLHCLTGTMVEKLRPLVEGTVSQEAYVQTLYEECVVLSKSALGKHVLRCVGRAYRREGYRVLRTMKTSKTHDGEEEGFGDGNGRYGDNGQKYTVLRHHQKITDFVRDSWRDIQHITSAALASGKLVMVETKLKRLQKARERKRKNRARDAKMILTRGGKAGEDATTHCHDHEDMQENFYWNIGALSDEETDEPVEECMFSDDEGDMAADELDEEHFQHLADEKIYTALLSAHQTEVLWKLTKMDLDSTIREACRRMLAPTTRYWTDNNNHRREGWYAFFPSENSPYPHDWYHYPAKDSNVHNHHAHHSHSQPQDGWVGLDGNVVSMEVGRLRAAAALVLVGDIMVRCGKDSA